MADSNVQIEEVYKRVPFSKLIGMIIINVRSVIVY